MLKQHGRVALPLLLASTLITGCSPQPEPTTLSQVNRDPAESILGNVSADGRCDPAVVDIDHEKPTAYITYRGQPGDHVELELVKVDESLEAEIQSFELSDTQNEMQIPTSIPNESISEINVSADGRVGKPGQCVIEVN